MPYSEQLVTYGLTPLKIFYATEAVGSLLDRLMRHGVLEERPLMIALDAHAVLDGGAFRDRHLLVKEIENVAECSEGMARMVLSWLFEVAQYKPFLFIGFEAEPRKAIRLSRSPVRYDNLYERWGLGLYTTASSSSSGIQS